MHITRTALTRHEGTLISYQAEPCLLLVGHERGLERDGKRDA
jgi:hypothetical protein